MVKLIVSNRTHQQIAELSQASNIVYKKAIDSQGYCQFDLFLADPLADPKYINPSNYVHVFSDTADSTNFANALWGGPLVNDYEVKPKEGIITCMAAGMANLLEMSILTTTANFTVGTAQDAINGLLNLSDNTLATLGLTPYTTQPNNLFPTINNFVAAYGDSVLEDIYKICRDYAVDFDVRPDWTYAILARQGVDNPNLVVRYGNQGNVQVDSSFKLVNSELANQVTFLDNSGNQAFVVNTTSVQYYGPKSVLIQDGETYAQEDALTKAQLYAVRAAFPLNVIDNVTIFNNALLPFDHIRIGDAVLFEAATDPTQYAYTAVPLSASVTPLVLYATHATASSLVTALDLLPNGGASSNTHGSSLLGATATGYSEVYSQGTANAWQATATPGAASGHGFLYDTTSIEDQEIVAGTWTSTFSLRCNNVGAGVVTDLVVRYFVWHSGSNSYTLLGQNTLPGIVLNGWQVFSTPAITLHNVVFAPGDKLYFDVWANVTQNNTGDAAATIDIGDESLTGGIGGMKQTVATPGYVPVRLDPNPQPNLGNVQTLPMLQAYNGLQRILAAEYNDRKQTMTLTLGNAVYKVIRNHLHEVRLYGNGGAVWGNIGG